MLKNLVLCLCVLEVAAFSLDDTVGLREYKSNCKICHGAPYKASTMMMSEEWEALFANSQKKLKILHAKDKKASEVLNGAKFNGDAFLILRFLKDNSSDSGKVRGCNGTSCG